MISDAGRLLKGNKIMIFQLDSRFHGNDKDGLNEYLHIFKAIILRREQLWTLKKYYPLWEKKNV